MEFLVKTSVTNLQRKLDRQLDRHPGSFVKRQNSWTVSKPRC